MKIREAFDIVMTEETKAPKSGKKGILFLDIDDTLLKASGIFIYKKVGNKEIKLTPEQYAEEVITTETKKLYDYREFLDEKKVENSIRFGDPIVSNLQLMDAYINKGWMIGILTARGMERVVGESIKKFLKYRNFSEPAQGMIDKVVTKLNKSIIVKKVPKGRLVPAGHLLAKKNIHGINDRDKTYIGDTDFEKKANILKSYIDQGYDVAFLDDDKKNIEAVRKLKLGIRVIPAHSK